MIKADNTTSSYLVMNDQEYTKHYYIEGERVCSKIGSGFGLAPYDPLGGPVDVLSGDFSELPDDLLTMVQRSAICAGYEGDITISEELKPAHNAESDPENDQYFYHPDHLGSSSYITDLYGNGIQHLQYLPFGENFVDQQTGVWNTPYKFSGKEKDDETGYSYFGARYYDSDLSVWLSVDPMADQRSWVSPYNYCQNNPIGRVDPTGALDGDYYGRNGTYLGSDGKNDDKVYVVENNSYISTPDGKKTFIYGNSFSELKNSDGTSFSHAKFKELAGTLYAESTAGSTDFTEPAGIYSVLENRANAVGNGTTTYDIASIPATYGVYGWNDKDKINSPLAPKGSVKSAYRGLIAGITESKDYSGGGLYWQGKDFGISSRKAYKDYYQIGFEFTNKSHDIWGFGNHKSGKTGWDYKYQSTGVGGSTTFMKLSEKWKSAVKYNKPRLCIRNQKRCSYI